MTRAISGPDHSSRAVGHLKSFAGALRGGGVFKVPSKSFQCKAFLIDLSWSSDSQAAENGNRRTPTFQSMLQHESGSHPGQGKEWPSDQRPEGDTHQVNNAEIRLQDFFYVPFAVQLPKPFIDALSVAGSPGDVLLRRAPNARVQFWRCVFFHATSSGPHVAN